MWKIRGRKWNLTQDTQKEEKKSCTPCDLKVHASFGQEECIILFEPNFKECTVLLVNINTSTILRQIEQDPSTDRHVPKGKVHKTVVYVTVTALCVEQFCP